MLKAIMGGAALLLISACSSGPSGSATSPTTSAATPAPAAPFRAPQIMRGSGAEGIIGQSADALTSRFGNSRIDLIEGDARKLQFVSATCVLDIFLYPLAAGRTPVATHIETRLRRGGMETDRASCVAEAESAAQ